MQPAVAYKDVCKKLADVVGSVDEPKVVMVGLLFARPQLPLAKQQVIPSLDYFHHRSGEHIHFFCAGYDGYEEPTKKQEKLDSNWEEVPGMQGWLYSAEMFDSLRKEVEEQTNRQWRYSGAVELLLTNAYVMPGVSRARLDFDCTVVCNLDAMIRDDAIPSVSEYFERIIQYAESVTSNDPTWRFSDLNGSLHGLQILKRVVLEAISKDLAKDVDRVSHFAVKALEPSVPPWWKFWAKRRPHISGIN